MFVMLFLLNFVSVFLAVWVMSLIDRRRKRAFAGALLEQIGQQAMMNQNFMQIIRNNFGAELPEDGDDR